MTFGGSLTLASFNIHQRSRSTGERELTENITNKFYSFHSLSCVIFLFMPHALPSFCLSISVMPRLIARRSVYMDMVMQRTAEEKRDTGTEIRDNVGVYLSTQRNTNKLRNNQVDTGTQHTQRGAGRNGEYTRAWEELEETDRGMFSMVTMEELDGQTREGAEPRQRDWKGGGNTEEQGYGQMEGKKAKGREKQNREESDENQGKHIGRAYEICKHKQARRKGEQNGRERSGD